MNNSDRTIEELKKVSLSQEEKSAIRSNVANFASSNFINVNSKRNMENNFGTKVPSSSVFGWTSFTYKIAVPALMLLIIAGGGTSFLAEKSLPGDALYPVKLNVNEKMESILAFNEKDSAIVDLNQAVRRLTEAETLAVNGKLTAEQDSEIKANFSKEVESFNTQVSKMEKKGDKKNADEVKTKFKKEMDDHERILVSYSAQSSTTLGVLDVIRLARGEDNDENEGGLAIAQNATASAKTSATLRKSEDKEEERDSDDDEDENDDDDKPIVTLSTTVTTSATVAPASTTVQTFTLAQVATHNSTSSCYTVVSGYVYDLTKWIYKHPGGEFAIMSMCGTDGTTAFNDQHGGQPNPAQTLETYKIGIIKK